MSLLFVSNDTFCLLRSWLFINHHFQNEHLPASFKFNWKVLPLSSQMLWIFETPFCVLSFFLLLTLWPEKLIATSPVLYSSLKFAWVILVDLLTLLFSQKQDMIRGRGVRTQSEGCYKGEGRGNEKMGIIEVNHFNFSSSLKTYQFGQQKKNNFRFV